MGPVIEVDRNQFSCLVASLPPAPVPLYWNNIFHFLIFVFLFPYLAIYYFIIRIRNLIIGESSEVDFRTFNLAALKLISFVFPSFFLPSYLPSFLSFFIYFFINFLILKLFIIKLPFGPTFQTPYFFLPSFSFLPTLHSFFFLMYFFSNFFTEIPYVNSARSLDLRFLCFLHSSSSFSRKFLYISLLQILRKKEKEKLLQYSLQQY